MIFERGGLGSIRNGLLDALVIPTNHQHGLHDLHKAGLGLASRVQIITKKEGAWVPATYCTKKNYVIGQLHLHIGKMKKFVLLLFSSIR